MRIVEVTGGLGNQMFQYAFGRYLSRRYPEDIIKYDLSYYNADNAIREYALKKAFGLELDTASVADIRKCRGYYPYDCRMKRLLISRFSKKSYSHEIIEDLDSAFDEDIVASVGDTYYSGYWQCENYFANFRDEILKDFQVTVDDETEEYKELLKEIDSSNSVAIHIRLEDYLQEDNQKIYGDICTSEYYTKAINYIMNSTTDCKFFLFSTDLTEAVEMLPANVDCHKVSYKGQKDYLDIKLMSRCKHNIIANSTFSWWGAWLNENVEKIVVCPGKWFNNHDVYNQYCSGFYKCN